MVMTSIASGVPQVLRDTVAGDPAGDFLTNFQSELFAVLGLVLADFAAPRNRDAVVALEAVDADVVTGNQLVELCADRLADLEDPTQARQSRPQLLDRVELRRPGRHSVVVLARCAPPSTPLGDLRLAAGTPRAVQVSTLPIEVETRARPIGSPSSDSSGATVTVLMPSRWNALRSS